MKTRYDLIVVGGGPGGSWAAKHGAEKGLSVLLLEKDREIGIPVRCAEGVSEEGIRSIIDLKPHWIAQVICGAKLVAPNGTKVLSYTSDRGYILHRRFFDADLARMASEAGADVLTKAYVHDLIYNNHTVSGIRMTHIGDEYQIHAKCVIGADGVESRIGRRAGIQTDLSPKEIASCVQMTLANIDINPELVEFYFGSEIAPEGYLWVFPKGNGVANVGLGISGTSARKKKPIVFLREFVERKYPKCSVLNVVGGAVPLSAGLKQIVGNGIMLVGDAAQQTNPLSGGGIVNAMIAGKIAGEVAAEAIKNNDVSKKGMNSYYKKWMKCEGRNNRKSYKIKKVIHRFSDDDLNHLAQLLLEIPQEERTGFRIFKLALKKHPKLIRDAALLFLQG